MQELTKWCSNNWRMVHGRQIKSKIKTRPIEVLWKTQRSLVENEITRMQEDEGRTESRFELRTRASKIVLEKLTEEEQRDLKDAAADMEEHGYSEDHKRRLAKRYHKKRVYQTMESQFDEMGMTSVVFVCYKDADGKPVVNRYAIVSIF